MVRSLYLSWPTYVEVANGNINSTALLSLSGTGVGNTASIRILWTWIEPCRAEFIIGIIKNTVAISTLRWHRWLESAAMLSYWPTQWTRDAIITSLLRQNDVAASFWRNNGVIIASCVRYVDILEYSGFKPTKHRRPSFYETYYLKLLSHH